MELKIIAFGAIVAVALLVCGCAGAVAFVVPALNNELPASQARAAADTVSAADLVVGTWKMVNPVVQDGGHTIEYNDSRWYFGADGSFKQCPLLMDLFKTTGIWTKVGTDRYEVICGKDSHVEHYRLADGQLCLEEDQRYVFVKT